MIELYHMQIRFILFQKIWAITIKIKQMKRFQNVSLMSLKWEKILSAQLLKKLEDMK